MSSIILTRGGGLLNHSRKVEDLSKRCVEDRDGYVSCGGYRMTSQPKGRWKSKVLSDKQIDDILFMYAAGMKKVEIHEKYKFVSYNLIVKVCNGGE